MTTEHILTGIKVLDLTHFLAGPAATRMMAEMGAEIIKVEPNPGGDSSRLFPFHKDGRSAYFVQQNRGKKGVCLDMRKPEGLEILKGLVAQVDVLIENFATGVMKRNGLDWEVCKKINPRLIMCSVTAFGQTGPLSHLPGFDNIGQAYAGVTAMIGEADGPPVFPTLAIGDVTTGVHAATAIGYALYHRERTGKGQHLDISLLDTYFHQHEVNVQMVSCSNGEQLPRRQGGHHFVAAPAGIYKGKDRYIFIIALTHQWPTLCKTMGMPELATDPRFDTVPDRVKNLAQLIEIIEGWIAAQDSDEHAIKQLEDARVPVAPVLEVEEAMAHPHLIERGTVRTISDRGIGEFQVPGFPLRFSEFPGHLDLDAPYLGEHNGAVLKEYLGYSDEQISGLENDGVLGSEPLPARDANAAE